MPSHLVPPKPHSNRFKIAPLIKPMPASGDVGVLDAEIAGHSPKGRIPLWPYPKSFQNVTRRQLTTRLSAPYLLDVVAQCTTGPTGETVHPPSDLVTEISLDNRRLSQPRVMCDEVGHADVHPIVCQRLGLLPAAIRRASVFALTPAGDMAELVIARLQEPLPYPEAHRAHAAVDNQLPPDGIEIDVN